MHTVFQKEQELDRLNYVVKIENMSKKSIFDFESSSDEEESVKKLNKSSGSTVTKVFREVLGGGKQYISSSTLLSSSTGARSSSTCTTVPNQTSSSYSRFVAANGKAPVDSDSDDDDIARYTAQSQMKLRANAEAVKQQAKDERVKTQPEDGPKHMVAAVSASPANQISSKLPEKTLTNIHSTPRLTWQQQEEKGH